MAVCGTCGANNPDDVRFCGACGTPLGSQGGGPREERRVVTVLFADLAGFTTRATPRIAEIDAALAAAGALSAAAPESA